MNEDEELVYYHKCPANVKMYDVFLYLDRLHPFWAFKGDLGLKKVQCCPDCGLKFSKISVLTEEFVKFRNDNNLPLD